MISDEIQRITAQLPDGVRLVAVSKYHPADAIREAYGAGQRLFGEKWHFIGHLQTNKVKYIAPYVSLIHSADSPRLLEEINKQALKVGRRLRCLLQLHVAAEETKFGFTPDEAMAYLDSGAWRELEGVELTGVMAMATNTDDSARIRQDFHAARQFFEQGRRIVPFTELSMGMSDDWHIAVDEGSTLIRIGTQIFGERQY